MKKPKPSHLIPLSLLLSLVACGRAEFGVFRPGADGSNVSKLDVTLTPMTETFEVANRSKQIDVLFVMDNSGSMAEEQKSTVDSFAKFIAGFTQEEADYQIGVVSTDQITKERSPDWWKSFRYANFPNVGPGSLLAYRGNARFIKSSEGREEAMRAFRQNITLGTRGSGSESGLLSVIRALSPAFLGEGGFNEGFLRKDAMLSVILVSDEDDSIGNADSRYTKKFPEFETNRVAKFVRTLKDAKPNRPDRVRLDLVVAPVDQKCATSLEKAATYTKAFNRLNEGVDKPSGKILNICSDFASELGDLGSQIAVQIERRFTLKTPAQGTPKVKLNGKEIPVSATAGFTFNPATNEVVINGLDLDTLPGFKVEVAYTGKVAAQQSPVQQTPVKAK